MLTSHRPARTARTRGRGRAALLFVGLVAVGASSCSQPARASADVGPATQAPGDVEAGASTQTLADGSSFLVAAPSSGSDAAIISGRLAIIGGNCVGLDRPNGAGTSALAFPHGTHLSEDGGGIVLPDGVQITLGDPVVGGGGSNTLDPGTTAFDPWPDAPSGCAGATYLSTIDDVSIGEAPKA